MTQTPLTYPHPDFIRGTIKECNGNLVLAAHRMGMSLHKLDRAIEMQKPSKWPALIRILQSVKTTNPKYRELTLAAIEEDLARRAIIYKSEALDELYAIATMPISENSAQNQVKLLAASRLYSETNDPQMGSEIDQTLRALNADYQRTAPRIKKIRETVREISYEDAAAIDVTPD